MDSISITSAAAERFRQLQTQNDGKVLRLAVREAGCSGLEYVMDFVDAPAANDLAVEGDGFRLYVDKASYDKALRGLTIDFQRDLLSAAFVYLNPNKKGECGCGASFSV
ncbi:MAG TPA: iron-sulfur cluster assembly accessory protein [Mariprofundaceae bacterium]|nr:iron-sulfur cluster assembly accessory protein [Mariprofundaceae bacterium]